MTGFRLADRVKETSTTTGTGTLTLAGAVTGFQSFNSGIGDGASTTFVIEDSTNWEVTVGKYTHSGTTLSRDTLIASSTGSAISWGAGTRNVFISEPSTAVLQGTVVKTASYTALASDSVILCNPGAAMTVTLPSAASATLGIRFLVKKIDSSAYVVTISDGASADVDHASSSKLYRVGLCLQRERIRVAGPVPASRPSQREDGELRRAKRRRFSVEDPRLQYGCV